jgi:2-amino-4-hydroxy-6-hydroxymethyldihydropteridine diphosphokinase
VNNPPALAYIGVGSNIRPDENVTKALGLLADTPGIILAGISTFYRTAPLSDPNNSGSGPQDELEDLDPDFLNGVLEIRTTLSSEALLTCLEEIERSLGRVRPGNRYAPRTIDLDLLLFGIEKEDGPNPDWEAIGPSAYVAHSDIGRRSFVAHPLLELDPDLMLPPHGMPIRAMAASFDTPGGKSEDAFSRGLRSRFLPEPYRTELQGA